MKPLLQTTLWFLSMVSYIRAQEECDGYKEIVIEKPIQIKSKNYPKFYPFDYKCGFTFKSPRGTRLHIICPEFMVYGVGSRCDVGGVRTFEYRTGSIHRYCGNYNNLQMNFVGSTKKEEVVLFDMYTTYVSWKGFLCNVSTHSLSPTLPPSILNEKTTTTTTTTTTKTTTTTTNKANGFVCKCGVKNSGGRVVGGEYAAENEYPWQAGILSRGSVVPYCGGSLVTNRHVVTAAHCIDENMRVVLGEHDTRKSESTAQYFDVIQKDIHPLYNQPYRSNDIAILTLDRDVTFSEEIQPICLPFNLADTFVDEFCDITGWGLTAENGEGSDILKKAMVKVMSNTDCQKLYGDVITDRMLCAGLPQGGTDTCQGDSGGPLACPQGQKLVLAGVTSFGYGCARSEYPGVYTRVTSVEDWVKSIIYYGKTCS